MLSFTLDIKVKASNTLLQKPENCYFESKGSSCIFSSGSKVEELKNEKNILTLKENSILERNSKNNYVYINGVVWVQNSDSISFLSLYGKIESEQGEFWLIENDNKILVRSIIGKLKIKINSESLEIPEGFQIWISGKDSSGKNTFGIPEIIPMDAHLKLWAEMYSGNKYEFKNKIAMLKNLYKDKREESSQLYQQIADRHVANSLEQERNKRKQEEKRRAYLLEIRRQYFERVFQR